VKINPVVGCAGKGEIGEEREISTTKCVDRTVCFHLIYQETQFCGHSPWERVNHVNIVSLSG
jgi:hypothetical protein